MLNERQIECFLQAVECRNFTTAAEKLYISQQAVSSHIASLEKDLGIKLFVRTNKSVVVTDYGAELYEILSDSMSRIRELQNRCRKRAEDRNTLTIGCQNFVDFGTAFDIAVMNSRTAGNNIQIMRESPTRLRELLINEEIDIVLLSDYFHPKGVGYNKLPLFKSEMMIAISTNNPRVQEITSYKSFIGVDVLIDQVMGEKEEETRRRTFEYVKYVCGVDPGRIIVVPTRESIYSELMVRDACAYVPDRSRTAYDDRLVAYPTGIKTLFYCLWKQENTFPVLKEFARQLFEQYGAKELLQG